MGKVRTAAPRWLRRTMRPLMMLFIFITAVVISIYTLVKNGLIFSYESKILKLATWNVAAINNNPFGNFNISPL